MAGYNNETGDVVDNPSTTYLIYMVMRWTLNVSSQTRNLRTSSSIPTSSIHYNVQLEKYRYQRSGIRATRGGVDSGIAKSQRAASLYAFPESILTRPYVELDRHQFPYVSNQDWRRILPRARGDVLRLRSINSAASDSTRSRRGGSRVNYCEMGVAYALPILAG